MTNKLKVFAMLLCVALFGTMTSCSKDNGEFSMPSNDNEIYNLLIGKWRVQMTCVSEMYSQMSWTGTMEFKESGELVANVAWRYVDDSHIWQASGTGEGSWALYKRHIDLTIPGDVVLACPDYESTWNLGSLFDYSGTIQSISENSMVILANQPFATIPVACKLQCTKIE